MAARGEKDHSRGDGQKAVCAPPGINRREQGVDRIQITGARQQCVVIEPVYNMFASAALSNFSGACSTAGEQAWSNIVPRHPAMQEIAASDLTKVVPQTRKHHGAFVLPAFLEYQWVLCSALLCSALLCSAPPRPATRGVQADMLVSAASQVFRGFGMHKRHRF